MASIESVRWPIEPHTRVKHLILQRHLDGWLPIMTSAGFPRLLYVDGFAGPGRYEGGEPGSPLIALRAAVLRKRPLGPSRIEFLFIEERSDRADALQEELAAFNEERPLPSNISYEVRAGRFDAVMTERLDDSKGPSPAIFAFIDPFGYSGLPMTLLHRIARVRHSECLINFAYYSMNRWGNDPAKASTLTEQFGTPDWQEVWGDEAATLELYRLQLKREFRYVCSFQMQDAADRTLYFLAFASNAPKGLSVMKAAMWKADPKSGRVFSDLEDVQPLMLVVPPRPLRELLLNYFRGRGWVSIDDVEEFVRQTIYSEAIHLRNQTLAPMAREKPAVLEVIRPPGARSGFPADTRVRFL